LFAGLAYKPGATIVAWSDASLSLPGNSNSNSNSNRNRNINSKTASDKNGDGKGDVININIKRIEPPTLEGLNLVSWKEEFRPWGGCTATTLVLHYQSHDKLVRCSFGALFGARFVHIDTGVDTRGVLLGFTMLLKVAPYNTCDSIACLQLIQRRVAEFMVSTRVTQSHAFSSFSGV
jgi:hypothetical protein